MRRLRWVLGIQIVRVYEERPTDALIEPMEADGRKYPEGGINVFQHLPVCRDDVRGVPAFSTVCNQLQGMTARPISR